MRIFSLQFWLKLHWSLLVCPSGRQVDQWLRMEYPEVRNSAPGALGCMGHFGAVRVDRDVPPAFRKVYDAVCQG